MQTYKRNTKIERFKKSLKYLTYIEKTQQECDICGVNSFVYASIQLDNPVPQFGKSSIIGFIHSSHLEVCENCYSKISV